MSKNNKGVRNGRSKIFKKTDYHCWYCGVYLNSKKSSTRTIDHQLPVSKGGETVENNLVPSCVTCNVTKDNMTLDDYRIFVKAKHKLKKSPKFYGEGRRTGPWIRYLTKL